MKTSIYNKKKLLSFIILTIFNLYNLFAQKSVSWVDILNLSVSNNNIVKTSGAELWGHAGAASSNILEANVDGWVQTTALETNKYRFLGLSNQNLGSHYNTINYSIYLKATGDLLVYENGNAKNLGNPTSYQPGDVVRIERISNTIYYKVNGNIFYTSTITSSSDLLVDVAFFTLNGALSNVEISDSFTGSYNSNNNSSIWNKTNTIIHPFELNSKLSIGDTIVPNGYSLAIKGNALFEEVKVQLSENWPDYVFDENYNLPTLQEVENYIKNNGHLKNIPNAEEAERNGILLGEMNSKLLQKIEELTLYIIQQQKEIQKLNEQNSQIEKQQKEINGLKLLINKLVKSEKKCTDCSQ